MEPWPTQVFDDSIAKKLSTITLFTEKALDRYSANITCVGEYNRHTRVPLVALPPYTTIMALQDVIMQLSVLVAAKSSAWTGGNVVYLSLTSQTMISAMAPATRAELQEA